MPPVILNDSDDEDADLVLHEHEDHSTAHPGGGQEPISQLDGSRDSNGNSIDSAERLRRQLKDAGQNLFIDSGEQSRSSNGNQPAQAAATSPVLSRNKRRHTETTSNPSVGVDATVQRTKTMKTYSTKQPSSIAAEKQRFFEEFNEDGLDFSTSQSASFSEQSRHGRSSGLPGSTVQANFVDHEPTVMFKDSGSTVPDNDSSHNRMVEQALQSKANDRTSMIKLNDADELQQKSSSFPWSASAQTDATKDPASNASHDIAIETDKSGALVDEAQTGSANEKQHEADEIEVAPIASSKESETAHGSFIHTQDTGKRYASPTVQVDVTEASAVDSTVNHPEPVKATQKAARGRKRKIQEESSEPLNSDDIAVGLPREQYKPRPSKRRSTQIAEEPVDYSIAPEKAARSKRSKTLCTSQVSSKGQADRASAESSQIARPSAKGRKSKRASKEVADDQIKCICGSEEDDGNTVACDTCDTWQHIACYYPESGNKLPKDMRHDCAACQPRVDTERQDDLPKASGSQTQDTVTVAVNPGSGVKDDMPPPKSAPVQAESTGEQELNEMLSQRPESQDSQASSQTKTEEVAFKRPASRLKPISKSKRSQTTIFEDHVEFIGMQSSPSLRQQQAARKSSLKDINKEALPPAKPRKSAKYPDGNDEEEDELAFDPAKEDEEVDAPPKKRGRGRPPKAGPKVTAKTSTKSAEKVIEGSDDEDEAEEEVSVVQPKKRGRGRPPKTQPAETEDTGASKQPDNTEVQLTKEKGEEELIEPDAQSKQSTATNMPTPSPDKPAPGKDVATPQKKSKGSPTGHSAVKNSSAVPLRVGLSKRQRIPSLLRMMKPPPKRFEK